eukprot:gnl/MRDRNA2_/MRDRNA2_116423_c0_seq1.p1 gnl/MRDRNA2_/MRDRNA2_116423_c0~~gnl/MRDRNA2_/MRDRNA2_116423_c0_seq1.p1  ORF type:complete len:353 (+),score=78.95 gnl/MRDRNA2_/MRDRNA2_116423_c0_seq1:93-1061(+)
MAVVCVTLALVPLLRISALEGSHPSHFVEVKQVLKNASALVTSSGSSKATIRREKAQHRSDHVDLDKAPSEFKINPFFNSLDARTEKHLQADPTCKKKDLTVLKAAYPHHWLDESPRAMQIGVQDMEKVDEVDRTRRMPSLYGELLPDGVQDMLCKVRAKPGSRYYDLGSGAGKTAAVAWLYGMKATGIEISDDRYKLACEAVERMKNITGGAGPGQLNFLHGSFFGVDFSDADVVFTNSVMFSDQMLHRLAGRASNTKPGTIIVTAKKFPGPWYDDVGLLVEKATWEAHMQFVVQKRNYVKDRHPLANPDPEERDPDFCKN